LKFGLFLPPTVAFASPIDDSEPPKHTRHLTPYARNLPVHVEDAFWSSSEATKSGIHIAKKPINLDLARSGQTP